MNQPVDKGFNDVVQLIVSARQKAVLAVNTALIDLYWQIGAVINQKITAAAWGDGVVTQLAAHIAQTQPGLRGFTRPNLFRMREFYLRLTAQEKWSKRELERQFDAALFERDVKKPHENPAMGVLLCASKDDEVVEYALSRSASPALIAQYQIQLPDKALLQAKLHEFYLLNAAGTEGEA